jgi:putative nucleotidyltransferase with HDIG domain
MAKSGNGGLQGFGSMWHLGIRFLGSLAPVGPRSSSEQWALGHLLPTERQLFTAMSGADRRHAIGVARRALALAEEQHLEVIDPAAEPAQAFVAAALLHDVGKIHARLGTFGRVWATLAALGLGRDRVVAWETLADPAGAGMLARQGAKMARYLQHDRIGAELLEGAGSDELTITWARDHHLPEQRWRVEHRLGECLKHADGD